MAEQQTAATSSPLVTVDSVSCWYLYIVETVKGKLYTGITTDVTRRLQQHQSGRGGAKFFRSDPPKRLRMRLVFNDRASASKEEYRIKQLSRQQKIELIKLNPLDIELDL
ncbi:MAG: GIY-YIG nuclease family protein [Halopseudomonas sp.]